MEKKKLRLLRRGLLLLVSLLLFPLVMLHAQQTGCEFGIEIVNIKHNTCETNGEIEVRLTGNDIQYMPNQMYKAYLDPSGTLDDDASVEWVTDNVLRGLKPGIYTVKAKALCQLPGQDPDKYATKTQVEVKWAINYDAPFFDFNMNTNHHEDYYRPSMSCTPTGALKLENVRFTTPPYKMELIECPASYTGDSVFYSSATIKPASVYILKNLPAGKYTVLLTDGCGATKWGSATVGTMSDNFDLGLRPQIQTNTSSTATCNDIQFYISWYGSYYARYASLYYEYAFYYNDGINDASTIQESDWKTVPNADHLLSYTALYTINEMRTDANKCPIVRIRIKGCPETTKDYPLVISPYNPFTEFGSVRICNRMCYYFRWSMEQYPVCLPFTWKLYKMDTSVGDSLYYENNTPNYSTTKVLIHPDGQNLPDGKYYVIATDGEGVEYDVRANSSGTTRRIFQMRDVAGTSPYYTNASAAYTNNRYDYCKKEYLHSHDIFCSSSSGTWKGATLEFNQSKSVTPGGSPAPAPTHTYIEIPKTYSGSSVYPFRTNYSYTGTPNRVSFDDAPYGTIWYYNITDSCGNVFEVSHTNTYDRAYEYFITGVKPAYKAQEDEVFECEYVQVTPTNMDEMYTRRFYGTEDTPSSSIPRLYCHRVSWPAGAVAPISNRTTTYDYNYIYNGGYWRIAPPKEGGMYVFAYNPITEDNYTDSLHSCLTIYDTIFVAPRKLALDDSYLAAFRCPDNTNVGYIQLRAKHGSGNYTYTLYNKGDLTTPLEPGNSTGIFTNWAANAVGNELMVVVRDEICARSFELPVPIHNLDNATVAWIEGGTRKCYGDEVRLRSICLGDGATLKWTFPDGTTTSAQNPVIASATSGFSGKVYFEATIPGCAYAMIYDTLTVSVADKLMYWNPDAEDGNWHNVKNWLIVEGGTTKQASAFPAPCTSVHIAGNAKFYPSLDATHTPRTVNSLYIGYPTCDTIIYHYGSSTAYPHYLRYSRAKVQYNFGFYKNLNVAQPLFNKDNESGSSTSYPNYSAGLSIPKMLRSRWYMLSAPLKHITGGDFGIGGYPFAYQRLYNASDPQTNHTHHDDYTREFNTLNQDLESSGHALALLMAQKVNSSDPADLGWIDHKNLESLKGVIELPYFMSSDSDVHDIHLHSYDGTRSKFQYFSEETLDPIDQYDYYTRGYKGYRFVYENDNDTVSLMTDKDGYKVATYHLPLNVPGGSSSRRIMIGNPFMSHISFDKVYAENTDVIKDNFWYGDGATESFVSYRSGMGGVYDGSVTGDIAPLQGFVVEVLDNPARPYLTLPLEGTYSVISSGISSSDLPKPRSGSQGEVVDGWFTVTGVTPPLAGEEGLSDSIRINAHLLFNAGDKNDIVKLVLPWGVENKIEPFFIGNDGVLHGEQVENTLPEVVKFGIESCYDKEGYLSFRKGGKLIKSAILYDKKEGVRHDVSQGGYYRFVHGCDCRYDKVNGNYTAGGLDRDRFELHFTYNEGLGISDEESDLSVSVNSNKELKVLSSAELSSVEVLNTSGIRVLYASNLSSTSYIHQLNVPEGTYIVKVLREGLKQEQRKLIVK
ncbi:T9SS C-terminal target domain-containing protein [Dysgonomonas sp. 216]|uniref:T9SS type A sorting domain-containing protein n=1 Tax=Dysgonomonas sp. 216 TaxID=2302934 RepID=UPI0013D20BC0|nr:T9SS type A sorting domain-containing protein [Dysgonomonas sp. 216]NDW18449.1 T9SS C-terminal target domain-containing protein [Dysgonomonas sp. 216]